MQEGSDGGTQGISFRLWEFHGEVDAVKDPSENFFACVPHTLTFKDQFLLRDWILAIMASGCRRGKYLVDGVQEGPTIMAKDSRVG